MRVVGGEGGGQVNHGSQHVPLALASDVNLGSTPMFHRGWQSLYRWVSQHSPQGPVSMCVYPIRASPLNMGLILQTPRQP